MYWENDWAGFFVVYFKWCYYLCVIPFRLKWVERERKFRLERNWLQRMACASLYILLGMWYIKDLRKTPVNHLYKDPIIYFSLAFSINAICYHNIFLALCFWIKQERFLSLVNFDCGGYAKSTLKKRIFSEFLCFLFASLAFLYTVIGYNIVPKFRELDPCMLLRCLVVEGRFAFFLNGTFHKDEPCNNGNPPPMEDISAVDLFVAGLAWLMEVARQIAGFFSDFFPLTCCLSLWTCTDIIRGQLNESEKLDQKTSLPLSHERISNSHAPGTGGDDECLECKVTQEDNCIARTRNHKSKTEANFPQMYPTVTSVQGEKGKLKANQGFPDGAEEEAGNKLGALKGKLLLERYEICKAFSDQVNKALGHLLFLYVLSSIMYLSTCMDAVLVLEDWFGKFRVTFFFTIFILMFFIGSETVNKVSGLRTWLSNPSNNAFLSERNLFVLIHEISHNSIGVSGHGMFTVTYSTFMTVMTTTVTFFIINLQFQKPEPVEDSHQNFSIYLPTANGLM